MMPDEGEVMRMTLRSWTWEYGGFITVPGCIAILLLSFFGADTYASGFLTGCFNTTLFWYSLYGIIVHRRYPNRGDLPEWKEYAQERDAYYRRLDESEEAFSPGL
jgi:hypothetical protein